MEYIKEMEQKQTINIKKIKSSNFLETPVTYKKKNNISVINQESNCKPYKIMNSS